MSAQVLGIQVNTRYATWLELALISLLVPNASFLGHLCGIMAGILYVEVPTVLYVLNLVTGVGLARSRRGPSYTYSSGTTSGSPSSYNSGNGRGTNVRPCFSEKCHTRIEKLVVIGVASNLASHEVRPRT